MKTAWQTSILVTFSVSLIGTSALAQSILNQSNDDLLKGFDAGKSLTAPSLSGPAVAVPAPTWAPQSSAPGSTAGVGAQNGSPPGAYQFPPQLLSPGQPQKGMLQRIIEGAMNAVNVSSTDADGTHVKVPFVNVDVGGKGSGVKVKAPFVNYDTDHGAKVHAPFVKVGKDDGVKVKAPFVNINRGGVQTSPADQGSLNNQGSSLK